MTSSVRLRVATALVLYFLAGCDFRSSESTQEKFTTPRLLAPGNVDSAVLTDRLIRSSAGDAFRPSGNQTCFSIWDEVFLYTNLSWEWSDTEYQVEPRVEWYRNGQLFDRYSTMPIIATSSLHIWESMTGISLGPGSHKVELWEGSERLVSRKFMVKNPEIDGC